MSEATTTAPPRGRRPTGAPAALHENETLRRLAALLADHTTPPKMTYEEFLDWADEDTLAEWVEGEVVMSSPAAFEHQDLGGFLEWLLRGYVRRRRLGVVLDAPFQMKLPGSGREPDLLFVAADRTDQFALAHFQGAADLTVEIISEESVARDRGDKFYEYEQAGVREYWLLDPIRCRAEFYRLGEDGRYKLVEPDLEGVFRSEVVPGFWLRVEWLWQDPLPSEVAVLAEIAGVDPGLAADFERALSGQ